MYKSVILLLLAFPATLTAQPFTGLSEAVQRGDFGNLESVLISRDGEIVFEDYYRGAQANDLQQVQSVTKSVGSALIGIAHRQGRISLDQGLDEFFGSLYPMNSAPYLDKTAITVRNVLQQRHGITWDESSSDYRNAANPVNQMINSPDWYDFILRRPTDAAPDQKFTYNTGASTLMSRMIRVATGMGPEAFAMQELFGQLGIGPVHWEGWSEAGMGGGLTNWPNPDGDAPLGFGLWLKPRDMLKFGELYLNRGVYRGRRILDESWIDASWTRYSHEGNSPFFTTPGSGHGFQWWVAPIPDTLGRNWHTYFASGWGGQVIFVVPELDLVVVSTAENHDYNGPNVDVMMATLILPALEPLLDSRYNGAWFDPAANGQGLNLEVAADGKSMLAFWYTFGANGHRWFTMQGSVNGSSAQVTIYESTGGIFLEHDPTYQLEIWGSGTFRTVDCDNVDFTFESNEVSGSIPLTRLTGECFTAPD